MYAIEKTNHDLFIIIFLMLCSISFPITAATNIKVATPAPTGSIYHRVLQEIGSEFLKNSKDSKFTIYANGSQGNEINTIKRMRVGQLDASMLTVNGLQKIDQSVTALQLMPFVFRSWEEFDYVHDKLRIELEQKFFEKGFKILFWGEGGWVQFFSTEPRLTPEDFKTAKIFSWAGTPSNYNLVKSLGYNPVVLELSDILSSLQTGMIDVVPSAPMWALAFQFYKTTHHMLRMNYVPIMGATVMTRKTWESLTTEEQEVITTAASVAEKKLRENRNVQDENTIKAMQVNGLTVHEPTPDVEKAWQDLMEKAWPLVRGSMVPKEMFDRVIELLEEFRAL